MQLKLRPFLLMFLIFYSAPASAAEIRADKYGEQFNRAADKVGVTVRLGPPSCGDVQCVFSGDRGVTASAIYEDSDKRSKSRVGDSGFDIPMSFSELEVAAIFHALMAIFVPERPLETRQTFGLSLVQQLAKDGVRAEGRLGAWVFVLRYYKGERWRIIVRKPD